MSTFENDLRLEEIGTGERSGTWGTATNVNLELIANALSYSATGEAIANASTHTITMQDGTADEFRSFYLKCTGGGQACTVTLAPNTLSKVWMIENTTSFTLTFKQGSDSAGDKVAVLAGQVKMIATDGAGSGGAVFDLMQDLAVPDLFVDDDITLQSDAAVLGFGVNKDVTLTHVHDAGLLLNAAMKIQFRDAAISVSSSADATLDIASDGAINLTAGTDVVIPANVGITFGTGEKIEGDSTDLTITSGAKINLTATSDVVVPANVGITFGTGEKIEGDNTDLTITSGAKINLAATSDVHLANNIGMVFGDAGEKIEGDGTNLAINSSGDVNITATTVDLDGNLEVSGTITLGSGAVISEAELELLDGLTPGTAIATKVVTTDANIDTSGQRNLTITGELDAATGDFSGIVDVAGVLTVSNTTASSSSTSGSLIVGGGLGVAADLFVGDDFDVAGDAVIDLTCLVTGVLTTTATQVATGGITSGSDIVSDTDSTDDLGTTSVRWANLFVDGITATDQITATGFTGTLDGILGSGAAATASVTTLDTSGAVNLNLATDSTSSTSGALIVDGGVGVAKKLFVGTDLDVDGTTNLDAVDIDGAVDMATTLAVAGNVDFNGDLDVDGTTNLDVVDIDGAVDMASTLNIGGTTNDGTTLTQITQSGTGRGLAINRNVASATRAMVGLAQLSGSGGTQAVLDVQQAVSSSRAIKVTADGSTDRFSVYGTGALVTTPPAGGHAVFNEGGVDVDFRVKSNGNAHMLFVDGGNDTVAIGTDDTNFDPVADNLIVGTGGGSNGITIYTGSSAGSKGSIFFADTAAGDAANSRKGQISYEQNNEIMTFFTNNSLALTLALNGSATIANGLTLTDGDLVVANTHGINFAATGDGAGTDTSETLHDYEEGTFTPLLSNAKPSGGSVTFSSQIGVYTKIGNVVSFSLSVLANGSTIESSSNEVLVVGLPYDVKNISSQHFPPASLFCDSGFNQSAATQGYIPVLINGTAGIKIFGILSAATSNQNVLRYNELGRGNTTTSFAFRIAGTYRTA